MKEKLLLLHGALGSKAQFHSIIEPLEKTFEVFTLNFDGHGGEPIPKYFSIELFTKNVIDFINAKAIDKVTIFGYSMGGYVALNAALQIPEKIKKVITLGTKFDWSIASAEKEVKLLNPVVIEEKVPKFAQKLSLEHQPEDWKSVMQKTAQMMMSMAKGAKLMDIDFKIIDIPVVLGIGSLDHMVSYEETEHVAKLLPNSELIHLEGVKHPIDVVNKELLLNYITST